MRLPFRLIDAFAHTAFTGNPAGVVKLDGPLDDSSMQAIAAEVNQAETAFVWPECACWRLRWFTPIVEVDLCGHATLAAAHVLGLDQVDFATRSGILSACRDGDSWQLDFPVEPFSPVNERVPVEGAVWVGRNRMDLMAVLEDEHSVVDFSPDFGQIGALDARGLIVTAPSDRPNVDYVCRFFAPQVGVYEDAVTGSAHCGLAPYWGARLAKSELVGYQASPRGGYVATRLMGARVILSGRATTVIEGELCL